MVFAHAPVIFPAVLGLPLPYRPSFYLHVGVLHLSLIVRVVGDLVDVLGRWRGWGGLLNAVALLLFMVNTGRSMALGGRGGESQSDSGDAAGHVRWFAFDAGQSLGEHTAPFDAVAHVPEGVGVDCAGDGGADPAQCRSGRWHWLRTRPARW